jgi:hypothetical protein
MTGTPYQILNNILGGTEFVAGIVDYSNTITLVVNQQITKKTLIYTLANQLGGEVDYTDNGLTINILNTLGINNNYQVRLGKNLVGITKIIDARGEITTTYDVDILELKNSNEYIDLGYGIFEVINIGDLITVIDPICDINIQSRCVEIEYDPLFRVNTNLVISNKIQSINDTIKVINNEKLTKEGLYNGIKIGPNEGFVAMRSDNKAQVIMNATEGISVYSDTGIGLQKNFYVDVLGKIQAKGLYIDGTSEFKGSVDVTNGLTNIKIAPTSSYPFKISYNSRDIFRVDTLGNADMTQISLRNDLSGASYLAINQTGMYAWNAALGKKTFDLDLNGNLAINQASIANKLGGSNNTGIFINDNGLYSWNASIGEKTFEIDTSGNAFFRGNVTSLATITGSSIVGSTITGTTSITGATIKTATSGRRLELTSGTFKGYNSTNNLSGVVIDPDVTGLSDIKFYHNGVSLMEFYDEINMYNIRPGSGASQMAIGKSNNTTYLRGYINFGDAAVQGLNIDNSANHTHRVVVNGTTYITSSDGSHSHTFY